MASDEKVEDRFEELEVDAQSIEEDASFLRQPLDVVGILGFGLYLAWFYLMMTCTIVGVDGFPQASKNLLVLTFLVGEACCAFMIAPLAKPLSRRTAIRVLAVVAFVLLSLPGIAAIVAFSPTAFFGSWGLSGVGALILLSLWGFFLAQLRHRQAMSYTALSALCAILVFALVKLALKNEMWPYASIIIALISVLLFFYWATRMWSTGNIVYPEKTRPPDVGSLLHTAGAMVANSFLLGYGFYAISSSGSETGVAVMIGALLLAALFKVYDVRTGPRYQVNMIIKVIAPVAAIVLLLMPFMPVEARYYLVGFMLLFAMIDEIMCWTAVSEYMHIHQVHPLANMAFGRFGDIVGLTLGFECASRILGPTMEGDVSFGLVTSLIVIAFVCLQAFFFRDNYTPLIAKKDVEEDYAVEHVENQDDHRHGAWQRRCQLFAEHYGLTPRQTEVLMMVARGYSMKSIEEELVVSNHTVKAHVYGIYQKANIHSRQQLVNMISEFEDDGVRPEE